LNRSCVQGPTPEEGVWPGEAASGGPAGVAGVALSLVPPPPTSARTTAAPPGWPPGLVSVALPSIARERWQP
jgi:hypothetical protein